MALTRRIAVPDDCLFCRMAAGSAPVDKVHEDDRLFVIRDINPRAPTHVILIPREHIPSSQDLGAQHASLLAHMFSSATSLAQGLGLADRGYRVAFNVGDEGGQTI